MFWRKHLTVLTCPGSRIECIGVSHTNVFNHRSFCSLKPNKNNKSVHKSNESSTKGHDSVRTDFKTSIIIPSTSLNIGLVEFKKQFSLLNDGTIPSRKLGEFKESIDKLILQATYDIDLQLRSIKPIIVHSLLNLPDDDFVELLIYLLSKGITILDNQVSLRVTEIMRSDNLTLKYKIIFGVSKKDVNLLSFRASLSPLYRKVMQKSFSPKVIQSIITDVYLPLRDRSKILEYLGILEDIMENTEYKRFADSVKCVLFDLKIPIAAYKMESISNNKKFDGFLKYLLSLPSTLLDIMFEKFILSNFEKVTSKTLFLYISLVYGDVSKCFPSLIGYSDIESVNYEGHKSRSTIAKDTQQIPINIYYLFFRKTISELRVQVLKNLIHDVSILGPTNEITKCFNFALFELAIELKDTKKNFHNYAMDYLSHTDFRPPRFAALPIIDLKYYYSNDTAQLLNIMDTYGSDRFFTLDTDDVKEMFQDLSNPEKDQFIHILMKHKFSLPDGSIMEQWIEEKPERIQYLVPDDCDVNSIKKIISLLTPVQMFRLITKYNENFPKHTEILKVLESFNYNIEYHYAALSVLKIPNAKAYTQLKTLSDYLHAEYLIDKVTEEQRLRLYNIFIKNCIQSNFVSGIICASTIVPSYRDQTDTIVKLTSYVKPKRLLPVSGKHKLPVDIFMVALKSSLRNAESDFNIIYWYKLCMSYARSIKKVEEKVRFRQEVFGLLQSEIVTKGSSPMILYKLYSYAESDAFSPDWKLKVDMSEPLEKYFKESLLKNDKKSEYSIVETLSTVAKYESDITLSADLISSLFGKVPDKEKIFFIKLLRNMSHTVPYVEKIGSFLHSEFRKKNPDVYDLLGLDISNPLINSPTAKRTKWMKFDNRYFSPLIEQFMQRFISKEKNISIKGMMQDSLGYMDYSKDTIKCLKFYELYHSVFTFRGRTCDLKGCDIDEFVSECKQVFNGSEDILPPYLLEPFMLHFLYTRSLSYDLQTMVKMIYIINNGDANFGKSGLWNIINSDEKQRLEAYFTEVPRCFDTFVESNVVLLYNILFSICKNSQDLSTSELMYFIDFSEYLLRKPFMSKKAKFNIMNCVFILVGKHSDLLSIFYKRMITILPEYKVSKLLITDLLYSATMNDFVNIDSILTYLIKSNDNVLMNQACESVIKRLMEEDQNVIAQELYVKYTQLVPRFKIKDIDQNMSWAKASKPNIHVDSGSEVSMQINRFKVKLYDYEKLTK